ncbi:MAG: hypothetical protein GY811_01045 [Myxococcales bacterium]|nr:hypothetical protein [Myxococcales bacterium]
MGDASTGDAAAVDAMAVSSDAMSVGIDAMPMGQDAMPFEDGGATILDAGLTPPSDADLSGAMNSGTTPEFPGNGEVAPGSADGGIAVQLDAGGLSP